MIMRLLIFIKIYVNSKLKSFYVVAVHQMQSKQIEVKFFICYRYSGAYEKITKKKFSSYDHKTH